MPIATAQPVEASALNRLAELGPAGRLEAYREGALSYRELWSWARRWPEEPPRVNDEYEWIVSDLADLD